MASNCTDCMELLGKRRDKLVHTHKAVGNTENYFNGLFISLFLYFCTILNFCIGKEVRQYNL